MRTAVSVLALFAAGCGSSGECEQSADCPGAEFEPGAGVCLEDVDRGDRYCTAECFQPLDRYADPCPLGRVCVQTSLRGESGLTTDLCVERRDTCLEAEGCGNGLDDDCNGETDENPCEDIICSEDRMCGEIRTHVCALVDDAVPLTRVCGPMRGGMRNIGEPCNDNADCYNNDCLFGYCTEACGTGKNSALCPPGRICPIDLDLPVCLQACGGNGDCPSDQTCEPFLVCDDLATCWVGACVQL